MKIIMSKPYSYVPKLGIKYKPSTYVDFGQGILQLIDSIKENNL